MNPNNFYSSMAADILKDMPDTMSSGGVQRLMSMMGQILPDMDNINTFPPNVESVPPVDFGEPEQSESDAYLSRMGISND